MLVICLNSLLSCASCGQRRIGWRHQKRGRKIHWFVDLAIAKGLLLVSIYVKKTYLSTVFLGVVGRLGVEMTVVLKFSSIVIPHHQILYFASQRALPVRRFNIQDLVDKVSMINHLHSMQERLTKVPPVITMFWLFMKKPEPEFCSC